MRLAVTKKIVCHTHNESTHSAFARRIGQLRWIVKFSLCALLSFCLPSQVVAQNTMTVKYYKNGYTPNLRRYLDDVLNAAMEKTEGTFGEYAVQYYPYKMSSNRAKLETERGKDINILFSSHWHGHLVDPSNVIRINVPVFRGLLGLRQLVVTEEGAVKVDGVTDRSSFLNLTAGQGSRWIEVEILESNGITVIEAQQYDSLFPMLVRKRFDYLPLSILEVEEAVQKQLDTHPQLRVNTQLNLFYPLPIFLFVNAKQPQLAQRLEQGLRLAVSDGTVDFLFEKHFSYIQKSLGLTSDRIVVLNNPLITSDMNNDLVNHFLERYSKYYNQIIRF